MNIGFVGVGRMGALLDNRNVRLRTMWRLISETSNDAVGVSEPKDHNNCRIGQHQGCVGGCVPQRPWQLFRLRGNR